MEKITALFDRYIQTLILQILFLPFLDTPCTILSLHCRIKKGYPIEVEIVCEILPGILSDFFSASDILTKVIGEFLSPNQPHKRNMAAIVFQVCFVPVTVWLCSISNSSSNKYFSQMELFQVFSQACDEDQLPLLLDWVVYSLNNLTHNLPVMMAGWSLCCIFISASINPWLKSVYPFYYMAYYKYYYIFTLDLL